MARLKSNNRSTNNFSNHQVLPSTMKLAANNNESKKSADFNDSSNQVDNGYETPDEVVVPELFYTPSPKRASTAPPVVPRKRIKLTVPFPGSELFPIPEMNPVPLQEESDDESDDDRDETDDECVAKPESLYGSDYYESDDDKDLEDMLEERGLLCGFA